MFKPKHYETFVDPFHPVVVVCVHAAILEHFKVVGKPCFVHYMNFSACRLCGFDYRTKAPPTGESDESSKSKAPSTILSQKSDPHGYSQWDHRGFKKFTCARGISTKNRI